MESGEIALRLLVPAEGPLSSSIMDGSLGAEGSGAGGPLGGRGFGAGG